MAEAVAYELGLPLVTWYIKSTSRATIPSPNEELNFGVKSRGLWEETRFMPKRSYFKERVTSPKLSMITTPRWKRGIIAPRNATFGLFLLVAITGERKSETKSEENGSTRSEFRYGKFSRVIPLPARIQNTNVTAEYKDGILNLTLPKSEEEKIK